MFLLIAAFLAGILTSLAPCILPLLPVIVGSSVLNDKNEKIDRRKPYIIAASLGVSVVVFTLLLKASSLLVHIDPQLWTTLAGGIVVLLGLAMLFPNTWALLSARIGLEHSSNQLLSNAYKHSGVLGAVLTGAALGPVFSSCSPVYALVLATVLPVNLGLGILYMAAYALGLGLALLAIALAGRRLTAKLGWAVNPGGAFRKILAVILIIVGVLVITGINSRFQAWAGDHLPFATTRFEEKLLPQNKHQAKGDNKTMFNVDPYQAPEITGIAEWVNSDPLTIAKLKGKVVLIDFWTYSCINCIRTQPYLNAWYDKYKGDDFVIIGVHAPEFAFEKMPANVRRAVQDEKILYPVALDNDYATWKSYENQYWPAKYLIDKDGKVRYTHFGEGAYDETEKNIQTLLKEGGHAVTNSIETPAALPVENGQTPETYLGYERGHNFSNAGQFAADKTVGYTLADDLSTDEWSLGGSWQIGAMDTVSKSDNAVLRIKFSAKEVYLVMDGPKDAAVSLTVDGKAITSSRNGGEDVAEGGRVHIDGPRLYKLVKLPVFTKDATLDITLPKGVTVNAFTFGG
jgi:cytochrome c biogenesis protein CcdA/thiol-disulfide isomerase/thioredoxin